MQSPSASYVHAWQHNVCDVSWKAKKLCHWITLLMWGCVCVVFQDDCCYYCSFHYCFVMTLVCIHAYHWYSYCDDYDCFAARVVQTLRYRRQQPRTCTAAWAVACISKITVHLWICLQWPRSPCTSHVPSYWCISLALLGAGMLLWSCGLHTSPSLSVSSCSF